MRRETKVNGDYASTVVTRGSDYKNKRFRKWVWASLMYIVKRQSFRKRETFRKWL